VLLSIGGDKKVKFLPEIKRLSQEGWEIYTTTGTHQYLKDLGIETKLTYKISESEMPNVETIIANHYVDLIINIPRRPQHVSDDNVSDGFKIRRLAVDHHIPLITNLQIAELTLRSLAELYDAPLQVKSWREFMETRT
jgi:carbamoyl-phosphate synthase large subunit